MTGHPRRPRRAPGEFIRGDVVVVKPRRFRLEGIVSSTERRVGFFVEAKGGVAVVYCPRGGFAFSPESLVVRASAPTERRVRHAYDRLFATLAKLRRR